MKNSSIEWCDHTFNPWIGCTKVSEGCAHCYAEVSTPSRSMSIKWGKGQPRQRTSVANWKEPVKWNNIGFMLCPDCGGDLHAKLQKNSGIPLVVDMCKCGSKKAPSKSRRRRVFCASLADWLDDEVPIEWLADLLKLIHDTPNLDWLLLTKRPENFFFRLRDAFMHAFLHRAKSDNLWLPWLERWTEENDAPSHVWIGTTVENQKMADKRIPELRKIPARVRFLSCEPLLEDVRLFSEVLIPATEDHPDCVGYMAGSDDGRTTLRVTAAEVMDRIHWAIVGGESGPKARPCNVDWIRSIRNQCYAARVPVFVKQLGADSYTDHTCTCGRNTDGSWKGPSVCFQCGGRLQLKDKKGGDITEWPDDLRCQEFPK